MDWVPTTIGVHTAHGLFSVTSYDEGNTYTAHRFYSKQPGRGQRTETLFDLPNSKPLDEAKAACEARFAELEAAKSASAA